IFYYLNITIPQKGYLEKQPFAKLVDTAIEKDRNRFCNFFQSSNTGGISFQLLESEALKKIYCENCTKSQ
ncbi:MAG: hypothetical protein WBA74_20930, partial [Cyclobacteriaceae bacterium]